MPEKYVPRKVAYYYVHTRQGEDEVRIRESVAAAAGALGLCKVLCWLSLIASRNSIPSVLCYTELHSLPTKSHWTMPVHSRVSNS